LSLPSPLECTTTIGLFLVVRIKRSSDRAKKRKKSRFSFLGPGVAKLPGMWKTLESDLSLLQTFSCEPKPPRDAALPFGPQRAIIFLAMAIDGPVLALFQQYQLLQQSTLFDVAFCLKDNPDVVCAGLDPLLHYPEYRAAEGRAPSADFYVPCCEEQCQEAVHYA